MIDIVLGPKVGMRILAEYACKSYSVSGLKGPETIVLKQRKQLFAALYAYLMQIGAVQEGEKADIVALNSKQKVRNRRWNSLFWRTRLPKESLLYVQTISLSETTTVRLWVPSPSFALFLLKPKASDELLFSLACELSGYYFIRRLPEDETGTLTQHAPLCSKKQLVTFAKNMPKRTHFRLQVMRIAHASFERLRSPMETMISAIFTWSYERGGAAFSRPSINWKLSLVRSEQILAGQTSMELDFFWKASLVRVEYDSTAFHASSDHPEQVLRDQHRQNIAESRKIRSFALTKDILFSPRRLYAFLQVLSRALGEEYTLAYHLFKTRYYKLTHAFGLATRSWMSPSLICAQPRKAQAA